MIKFGMSLAQIFNQLVRGYQKITGAEPKGLDLIKIKQEAMKRFKDMNKVVDMEGTPIDTSKGIMGGKQIKDVEDAGEGFIEFVKKTDPKGAAKLQKTEDEIKAAIEAGNKRYLDKIKKQKKEGTYERFKPSPELDRKIKEEYQKAIKGESKEFPGKFKGTEEDFRNMIDDMTQDFATGGRAGFAVGTLPNVVMRLVRGFMKVTGRKPNKDEMEKILFEAADTDIGKMASDDYAMKVGGGLKAIKRRMDEIDRSKLSKMVDDIKFAQGGRAGFKEGLSAKLMKPFKIDRGTLRSMFFNKNNPIITGFNTSELFDLALNLSSLPGLADGGRIGYKDGPKDPRRRTFMKAAAGLASLLPFGLGKVGKVAAPVVAKAAEISGPALAKIVDTVMSLGKFVSLKGKRVKDMVTKKKHEGVEVTEDIADGSYIIKKDGKEIYYKPGRMDETGGIEDDIIEVIEKRIEKAGGGGIGYMLGE